jgi:small GTP-binding protein
MPEKTPGEVWIDGVHKLGNDTLKLIHERQATNLAGAIMDVARAIAQQVGVAVIGKRSSGKSTLINALLGADVTPMEDDVATNTYIRISEAAAGEPSRAIAVFRDPTRNAEDIPLPELSAYATAKGIHSHEVAFVEIEHESPLLHKGIVLFDTPGLGGLRDAHTTATMEALEDASAVVMVVDARVPVDREDLALLETAAARVRHVIVVGNKADESDNPDAHIAAARNLRGLDAAVRALSLSAWLERRAHALESESPVQAAALHELSAVASLRTELAHVSDAVMRGKYALLLGRIAATLGELTRADREQVEMAERGEDPATRVAELSMELERLGRVQPGAMLNLRMSTVRQEVTLDYSGAVARAFAELRQELEAGWTPGLQAQLPEASESRVRAAWLVANNALRKRAAEAGADVYRELGLDAGEVLLVPTGDPDADQLPDSYARSERVPLPSGRPAGVEHNLKRAMRVMFVAGAANLAIPGLGVAVLPIALPLGFHLSHLEDKASRERQSRQSSLSYLAGTERAATALGGVLNARATK